MTAPTTALPTISSLPTEAPDRPVVRPRDLDPEGIAAVDAVLDDQLAEQAEVLLEVSPELAPVVEAVTSATAGGKRLRAAFCLWGARAAAGGDLADGVAVAGAALEMFHLAALVHDDVMDHSDERRGLPTVHRSFAERHRADGRAGDAEDFGEAVAVLAGDLCLTWSDDLVERALRAAPVTAVRARAVWSQMRTQVLAGQYLDVLGQTRTGSSPEAVRRVLQYKSAKYTVEHPLLLGGVMAGATPALLEAFSRFGLAVGEAFQLRDDVLGVFGDPAATGKPAVDDLREGKRTLLVAWAEESADDAQREVLRRCVGDPGLDETGLHRVRQVMLRTGAVDRVERHIADLVDRARGVLDVMGLDARSHEALVGLTDACAWRAA